MPVYVYACTSCGHQFEQQQSFTDDALTTCPECEGALRKVFNSVGIVFKGSGFYRTDSRSNGKGTLPAPKKDGEGAKSSSAKESGSSGADSPGNSSGSSSSTTGSGSSSTTSSTKASAGSSS